MVNWKYDLFLYSVGNIVDMFFREVVPRGAWRVPQSGPVLFVAAPHANQFVDALILQRTLRNEATRRVSLLIAQKSVHGFIGWGSRQVGAVPVGRAQDSAKPATGTIYLPDPINDPTLIRGIGTKFGVGEGEKTTGANVDIAQIISPEEVRVKRPFKGKLALQQLTGRDDIDESGNFTNKDLKGPAPGYQGTKYKLAPHIDQTKVYEAVFSRLRNGGCVGIFPEGGSHDRTELLPLKAGVAIMALGTLAEDPDCGLKIVPVGMNYFHAHKFRSRAVVEFGAPFEIPRHLVELYRNNQRREAIGQVIDTVYQALSSVTVSAPNYDNLMMIQAARRLYNPTGKKLPLPVVVELNRRLSMGYERYKDDERITSLSKSVKEYNSQLHYLNLKDHQVQYARMSIVKVIFYSIYRSVKLLFLFICTVPGLLLFSPVFVATKVISRQKAKTALAGSTVKIRGRDVMATWKILVAIGVAPMLYHFYSILLCIKVWHDRLWGYVPEWVPLWAVYFAIWPVMVGITFAALRFGEVGMDIFKSLRPLVLCLQPSSSYNIQTLRVKRAELSAQVTELINTLGPEMFPDFDKARLVPDFLKMETGGSQPTSPEARRRRDSDQSSTGFEPETPPALSRRSTTQSSRALPRNDSFSNIGSVGIFSTRPPSRARSRSRSSSSGGGFGSGGFPLSGFTTLDSAGGFDEASRKIREAMKTRRRKTQGQEQEEEEDIQKMAFTIKSLVSSVLGGGRGPQPPPATELFTKTDPAVDGDDCLHDCDGCSVRYPRGFKIDTDDVLYGQIKAWSTHLLVGTGKADWVRDVADEKGSVMEAVDKASSPTNGNLKLSASNMPTPHDTHDYSEPTTALLLPAFTLIHNVHPLNVPQLVSDVISHAPTSTSPMTPFSIPATLPSPSPGKVPALTTTDCPHRVVILMCSQRTRDVRCGQSAPLLRKELERQLRPLGLYRDLHDERPGGVGIYFISHVGGHKYSANVMVYRRPNAFGLDDEGAVAKGDAKEEADGNTSETNGTNGTNGTEDKSNGTNGTNGTAKETNSKVEEKTEDTAGFVGAAQCIWLARVMPEDCENLVKYTVLRGKVVKPETQLRGGFDRGRGVMSW
ncbi:Sucrase/ferredoxin-like-domain-containing protein [Dactylonectria estremocensis]|uniref:Sucrase/ferredoxin-like-domain-containing protein n=1 Tax=Dactylonectria estremocensis TaxID=1079267 RepID=A0A9P9FBM6_9HYPO|nr:Sucrase/ferredoxin-like-domain-containing protein [Dactylonectria estremocensis]